MKSKIHESKRRYTAFLPIALLLAFAACQNKQPEQQPTTESGGNTTVEVVNPSRQAFVAQILITGSAMSNRMVTLHAMESGFVKTMRKDIGDAVQKGEVVALLENPELAQMLKRAEADLERSKASLLKAEANLLKTQAMDRAAAADANRLNAVFVKTPSLTPAAEVEQAQAAHNKAQYGIWVAVGNDL